MSTTPYHVVLVTCANPQEAATIAHAMVEKQLAACVNILESVTSVYRWEGAVKKDNESLLIIKTTQAALPALRAEVQTLHSYDVPEFIALPIQEGSPEYMSWLAQSVHA